MAWNQQQWCWLGLWMVEHPLMRTETQIAHPYINSHSAPVTLRCLHYIFQQSPGLRPRYFIWRHHIIDIAYISNIIFWRHIHNTYSILGRFNILSDPSTGLMSQTKAWGHFSVRASDSWTFLPKPNHQDHKVTLETFKVSLQTII